MKPSLKSASQASAANNFSLRRFFDGPAHAAGVSLRDKVREVAGEPIDSLADFYRAIWSQGVAGVTVPLTVERAGELLTLPVQSVSREQFIKQPARH